MPQPTTQASLSTRFNEWLRNIPLITRWILAVNVFIYLYTLVFRPSLDNVCMRPVFFVFKYQVFRFLSSPFFHGGVLHIAFNMMAFVPMGSSLERVSGSANFLHLNVLFMIGSGVVMVLVSYVLACRPFQYVDPFVYQCSIGYSGILFGLIVIETHHSQSQSTSIFGFFSVPTKLYPWALLILIQIIVPNASWIGHLGGILIAYLYVFRLLNWALLPPWLACKLDTTPLGSLPAWITNPGYTGSSSRDGDQSPIAAFFSRIRSWFSWSSSQRTVPFSSAGSGVRLGGSGTTTYQSVPSYDADLTAPHTPSHHTAAAPHLPPPPPS